MQIPRVASQVCKLQPSWTPPHSIRGTSSVPTTYVCTYTCVYVIPVRLFLVCSGGWLAGWLAGWLQANISTCSNSEAKHGQNNLVRRLLGLLAGWLAGWLALAGEAAMPPPTAVQEYVCMYVHM